MVSRPSSPPSPVSRSPSARARSASCWICSSITARSAAAASLACSVFTSVTGASYISGVTPLNNPDRVDVDYHHFAHAESESRRAHSTTQRLTVLREIVDAYRGELGAGIDSEWIHTVRHAAQRTAINAISELARHHAADDPRHTLELLETATGFDPYNEHLYRDIMRLQDRLGIHDGIPRTLALLEVRLRDIDCKPAPETQTLASALQHRHAQHVHISLAPTNPMSPRR
ncbi:hypothetical protein FDZ84_28560 [Saccharopolyspora sp. ASAGF58]|nr:hypothetical protein FDZ84_28560 [Saccharopolyspora sp. ASAGF58]